VVGGRPGKKLSRPHLDQKVGVVAFACHPKLHGRLRLGGLQLEASLSKKVCEIPSQ
jgi:hypothetical protein